jgi:hypothetical protein
MDVLVGASDFARFIGGHLDAASSFRLIDVGCSGGVHKSFRAFGQRLAAWAFDIDGAEIERLQKTETLPGIHYFAGKVGLPEGHPFLTARSGRTPAPGYPAERLSFVATQRRRGTAGWVAALSAPLDISAVVGDIDLASFLSDNHIDDLDFLKIDVDGEDFAILSGLEEKLTTIGTLAVGMEVNFYGTDHPTDHTFHNVDRFLRRHGFDLFALSFRRYSVDALPARYELSFPAQTEFGRLFQGDALYVRDICVPSQRAVAEHLSPEKLVKAAAIFSLANLPDCAAEILTTFGDRLESLMDVGLALDLLTKMARHDDMPTHYRDYVAAFAADAPCFYPQR